MPLQEIRATFRCDRCDLVFSVTLDPAFKVPKTRSVLHWTTHDAALAALAYSKDYRGPGDHDTAHGVTTAHGSDVFCAVCTLANDLAALQGGEGGEVTYADVATEFFRGTPTAEIEDDMKRADAHGVDTSLHRTELARRTGIDVTGGR